MKIDCNKMKLHNTREWATLYSNTHSHHFIYINNLFTSIRFDKLKQCWESILISVHGYWHKLQSSTESAKFVGKI